jgi:hypothetical protein
MQIASAGGNNRHSDTTLSVPDAYEMIPERDLEKYHSHGDKKLHVLARSCMNRLLSRHRSVDVRRYDSNCG